MNNPLLYIDTNGKWPTRTHNELIRKAFTGLSKRERRSIQRGSRDTDAIKGVIPITLLPSEAHKHAMRQRGEAKEKAIQKSLDWLQDRREAAQGQQSFYQGQRSYQGKDAGLSPIALYNFGEGAHTIMDNTSPAHSDYKEYIIPDPSSSTYSGPDADMVALGMFITSITLHSQEESRQPTKEEEEQAINDMRHYFGTIFGEEKLKKAITPSDQKQSK